MSSFTDGPAALGYTVSITHPTGDKRMPTNTILNTNTVRGTVRNANRISDRPTAFSTPAQDLFGFLSFSAGLGAGLAALAAGLSHLSAAAPAFQSFLGLG